MESQRSVYASNNFFSNLLMFIFILRSFETNDLKKKTAFLGNVNVEVIFLEKKMSQYYTTCLGEDNHIYVTKTEKSNE